MACGWTESSPEAMTPALVSGLPLAVGELLRAWCAAGDGLSIRPPAACCSAVACMSQNIVRVSVA